MLSQTLCGDPQPTTGSCSFRNYPCCFRKYMEARVGFAVGLLHSGCADHV